MRPHSSGATLRKSATKKPPVSCAVEPNQSKTRHRFVSNDLEIRNSGPRLLAEGTLYAPEQVCVRVHVRACMHACVVRACVRARGGLPVFVRVCVRAVTPSRTPWHRGLGGTLSSLRLRVRTPCRCGQGVALLDANAIKLQGPREAGVDDTCRCGNKRRHRSNGTLVCACACVMLRAGWCGCVRARMRACA